MRIWECIDLRMRGEEGRTERSWASELGLDGKDRRVSYDPHVLELVESGVVGLRGTRN